MAPLKTRLLLFLCITSDLNIFDQKIRAVFAQDKNGKLLTITYCTAIGTQANVQPILLFHRNIQKSSNFFAKVYNIAGIAAGAFLSPVPTCTIKLVSRVSGMYYDRLKLCDTGVKYVCGYCSICTSPFLSNWEEYCNAFCTRPPLKHFLSELPALSDNFQIVCMQQ